MANDIHIPADVPNGSINEYLNNYDLVTHGSGRLMLFAGDQKIEHLNKDFYGEGIHEDDNEPDHLFKIAETAEIGLLATQLGLISMYGSDYPEVPYLVKLNSKTNLVKTAQRDPHSPQLVDVEQVVEFKNNSGLEIVGIGYTVYLGSEFEHIMLRDAAQAVYKAHQAGLLSVLWIYPRGQAVGDEKDADLIAGATGIAACLGADFVKVNPPKKDGKASADLLIQAVKAAGKTKVICAGGSSTRLRRRDTRKALSNLSSARGECPCRCAGGSRTRPCRRRSIGASGFCSLHRFPRARSGGRTRAGCRRGSSLCGR